MFTSVQKLTTHSERSDAPDRRGTNADPAAVMYVALMLALAVSQVAS